MELSDTSETIDDCKVQDISGSSNLEDLVVMFESNKEGTEALDWKCFICDSQLTRDTIHSIFYTKLLKSGVLLINNLNKLLKTSYTAPQDMRSPVICSGCFNTFDDLETAEQTCRKLRDELVSGYRKTCELYNEMQENEAVASETEDFQTPSKSIAIEKVVKKSRNLGTKKQMSTNEMQETSDSDGEDREAFDIDLKDCKEVNIKSEPSVSEEENSDSTRSSKRKKITCTQCSREFRRSSELRKHKQIAHKKPNPNICPLCQRVYTNRNTLFTHLKNAHYLTTDERNGLRKKSRGKQLGKLRWQLFELPRTENDNEVDPLDIQVKQELDAMSEEEEGPENESGDEIGEKKKSRGRKVGRRATMPLIYACPTCGKKWRTTSELNAHIQSHSNLRPFVCEICGKGYKLRKALDIHVGMHKGVHPFTCHFCNKSFTQKIGLKKHLPIHTGVAGYQCDLCGRQFIHQKSFQIHKMIHSGEKSVSCPECNLALLSTSHLKRHMRVHTGEKPFECEICGKRFAERYNLNAHQRVHLPPGAVAPSSRKRKGKRASEKCELCHFTTTKETSLTEHWEMNHKHAAISVDDHGYSQPSLVPQLIIDASGSLSYEEKPPFYEQVPILGT